MLLSFDNEMLCGSIYKKEREKWQNILLKIKKKWYGRIRR